MQNGRRCLSTYTTLLLSCSLASFVIRLQGACNFLRERIRAQDKFRPTRERCHIKNADNVGKSAFTRYKRPQSIWRTLEECGIQNVFLFPREQPVETGKTR